MLFLVNTLWYGQSLVEVKLKFVLTHSHRSLASLILFLLLWHGQSLVEVKLGLAPATTEYDVQIVKNAA